jgi:hypothetical protein
MGPEAGRPPSRVHYFKHLNRTILQYVDHPEYKYESGVGLLTHRRIDIDWILLIDEEANKIEDQSMFITDAQIFNDKQEIVWKILALRQCDAEKIGVDRKTFQRIKERIRGGEINIDTAAVRRLLVTK